MKANSKLKFGVFLLIAALGATFAAHADKRPVLPEDHAALRSIISSTISPDGRWVAYMVSGLEPESAPARENKDSGNGSAPQSAAKGKYKRRARLWLISTDAAARAPARQLIFGEDDISSPQWSPDGRYLAFLAMRKPGAETSAAHTQVWLLPMAGGESFPLTQAQDEVSDYSWSPDGRQIAYLCADPLPKQDKEKQEAGDDAYVFEREFRTVNIWTIEVASRKAAQITADEGFTIMSAPSWSPDQRHLAFSIRYSNLIRDERMDACILDLATKELRKITATTLVTSQPEWSPDGESLALAVLPRHERDYANDLPDRGSFQTHLAIYDLASRTLRDLSSPRFDQDVNLLHGAWSHDGRRILFTSNSGIYSDVFAYEVSSGRYLRLTNGSVILHYRAAFQADRSKVAFIMDTATAPEDLYIANGDFSAPRRLTDNNPQVAQWALGETQKIQWRSSDGLPVEGLLLKPVGYREGERYPLLVDAHGGPTGAYMNNFRRNGQFWAGRGWAVLYPNPRGSTGYGEQFQRANISDLGGGDYRDIMSGVDALIERGIADGDKLAITGFSYGGYMTAWIVSQTARFKAAAMGGGFTNNESMYGTTDIPGYIASFFGGYPNHDTLRVYRERSPLTYADNVVTPLLILHGELDSRVPVGQAMEYYRALKIRNKPVELVLYPRASHGFGEYRHQIDRAWREYRWIAGYTLGNAPLTQNPVIP